MIPRLPTPWSAVKWLVGYRLDGGMEISLPTILPSPTYTYQPPSMALPKGDEIVGEPAGLALRIGLALRDGIEQGFITRRNCKSLIEAARTQVDYDRACQRYNALKLTNPESQATAPRPPSNGGLEKLKKNSAVASALCDLFTSYGVLS